MKKIFCVILVVFMVFSFAACNNSEDKLEKLSAKDFSFETAFGVLELNSLFDKPETFGEYEYFESQSCGYVGLDKVFTYDSFEVTTYPKDGKDYVIYIDIFDNAKTSRDVKIGDSKDTVIEKYGEEYTMQGTRLSYSFEDKTLCFFFSSDKVSEIEYSYVAK